MAKCSTNMSDPINLDSIMGEINSIGSRLELWGLDYDHMFTNIYRIGLRLQELYDQYKSFRQEAERQRIRKDMFDDCEKLDPVPRLTKKDLEFKKRLEAEEK